MIKFFVSIIGIGLGIGLGLFINLKQGLPDITKAIISPLQPAKKEVIGFLLYSLLSRAQVDYSPEITTLAYFGLILDTDGTILKLTTPQTAEPGWNTLKSGKADIFLANAKQHKLGLSLVVFAGNNDTITTLMQDPVTHANNLAGQVIPLMDHYGFTNLNLDIESTQAASNEAQMHFLQFTKTLKNALTNAGGKTLTLDIATVDVIDANRLIKPKEAAEIADSIVIMTYDYHSTTSFVSGPVAPLGGAGVASEYDVESAVQRALLLLPRDKLILGVPLYGYEWETFGSVPRSAVIPQSGATASNRRAEELVNHCSSCSAQFDSVAQEMYVIYADADKQSYHQLFYPTKQSMLAKTTFVKKQHLRGIAVWALGYEGATILEPLADYLR